MKGIVMGEFNTRAKRLALQKLRVTKDGKTVEMEAVEAVMSKQLTGALNGSVIAQREFLNASRTALAASEAEIADDCEVWGSIKARNQKLLDDARARGKVPPRVLPHPDDILIDAKTGVRIVGPVDAEDSVGFDARVRFRDALYVQQAMEDALDGIPSVKRPSSGTPGILAMLMDHYLPPSLQLSTAEQLDKIWVLMRRPKRVLLVDCRAAWRAAGVAMPRGKRLPPPDRYFPMLDIYMAFGKAVLAAGDDRDAVNDAVQTAVEELRALKAAQTRADAEAQTDAEAPTTHQPLETA
jgi:hypothetical protein